MSNTTLIESQARLTPQTFFEPNDGQQDVIDYARDEWDRKQPLIIEGGAGSGKTSMAAYLVAMLGYEHPAFLSYTGKAAKVLRSKVGDDVHTGTLHGAMYSTFVLPENLERYMELQRELETERDPRRIRRIRNEMRDLSEPDFVLQDQFLWQRWYWRGPPVDAIVIDESSMVGLQIGGEVTKMAKRYALPLIVIGDSYQLPPVKDEAFFTPYNCNAAPELTEIVRQAKGSPILEMASSIRNGFPWRGEDCDELVMYPREVDLWSYDMIICGTNKTRHMINDIMRRDEGLSGLPKPGEPLVALRNDHVRRIMNGEVFECLECWQEGGLWVTGRMDDGRELTFEIIMVDEQADVPKFTEAQPVDFAYAITCHKSQGSEWPAVLVIDESKVFRKDAKQWLYTACTRAQSHLTVAKSI